MTSYEFECALVYLAEQIIKTFGKDVGVQMSTDGEGINVLSKEPLIKDEEKLDTVKSFFALLGITKEIYYQSVNNCFYHTDDDGITYSIDFDNENGIDNIRTDRAYTIIELCGEEE